MEIKEAIRRIRLDKGMSQEQLSFAIGLDSSAVSRIESGGKKVTVDELIKIAECVNEHVSYFFTYPKRWVDPDTVNVQERISVTFEVSPDKRDILLKLVTGDSPIKL